MHLLNARDRLLANCQFDLEFETIASSCVFLSPSSDHQEQDDRRGKGEVTDKERTVQTLENRNLLYVGYVGDDI